MGDWGWISRLTVSWLSQNVERTTEEGKDGVQREGGTCESRRFTQNPEDSSQLLIFDTAQLSRITPSEPWPAPSAPSQETSLHLPVSLCPEQPGTSVCCMPTSAIPVSFPCSVGWHASVTLFIRFPGLL